MWPDLEKQILLELAQLQQLVDLYRPLVERSREEEPDDYNLAALAAMLQSLYNGIENIFHRILRELGEPHRAHG